MSFIQKNEHIIDYNFFFKTLDVLIDFWNVFYLLFFLNTSSIRLKLLFFFVQSFKIISDFLL